MAFPKDEIPVDFFSGGGNLTGNQAESLRTILNGSRNQNKVYGYHVDPNRSEFYSTINLAYAAADLELPAGADINITLAPSITHTLSADLTLSVSRKFELDGQSPSTILNTTRPTSVAGNFVLPDASAASSRPVAAFKGLSLTGNITATDNWEVNVNEVDFSACILTRNHGANDVTFISKNSWLGSSFAIADNDAPTTASGGGVFIDGGNLDFLGFGSNQHTFVGPLNLIVKNAKLTLVNVVGGAMFDLASAASICTFINCRISAVTYGAAPALFANGASASVLWKNSECIPTAGTSVNFSSTVGTQSGSLLYIGATADAPTNPFAGMRWLNTDINDEATWDGSYWMNGDIARKDVLLGVGSAAASFDLGWNVPAGGATTSSSFKLLKALTGASGADRCALGVSGTETKYGETSALTATTTATALNPTWNDGAGDDIKLYAETASATPGGTIAGSGSADVLVVIYFRTPRTL